MTNSGGGGAAGRPDRVHHPRFARMYARVATQAEGRGQREHREKLLAPPLTGRVVEVGAGHGLNFARYPSTVDEVVAVEPESHLRQLAVEAAAAATVPITVVDGTASALPLDDDAFDVVVSSLVLCSVPDQAVALAEMRRVLRPGGELRFYEHVRSEARWHARIQWLADHTIWPYLAGGCHAARNTAAAIEAAGFTIERCERFRFVPTRGVPTSPHILGLARGGGSRPPAVPSSSDDDSDDSKEDQEP